MEESVGNSFFHMLCGAMLFILAMICMIVGIHGVKASVAICRECLSDEVMYEISNLPEAMIISGEEVIASLLDEVQHTVCIMGKDSEVTIQRGVNPMQEMVSVGIKPESLFRVKYMYGIDGEVRMVCYTQVEE